MLGFNALDQRAWLQKQKNGDFLIHRKKVAFEFSQYKSPPPMFLAPPPPPLLLQADFRETKATSPQLPSEATPALPWAAACRSDGWSRLSAGGNRDKAYQEFTPRLQGGCRSPAECSQGPFCCCDPHLSAFARFRAATGLRGRQPWARAGLPGGSCNSALTRPRPAAGPANEEQSWEGGQDQSALRR